MPFPKTMPPALPRLPYRIGLGHDTHRLAPGGPLLLGGVEIPHDHHLQGHSDADVLTHALIDALLGALALGDIGQWFPDTDPRYRAADSLELLEQVVVHLPRHGYRVANVDCIVFAQRPKLAPWTRAIARRLAAALRVAPGQVSVKAKTAEGTGPVGSETTIEAQAVVLLQSC